MDEITDKTKEIVFYYLDSVLETADIREYGTKYATPTEYTVRGFFILFMQKNELYFSQKEADLIKRMFVIDSDTLQKYLSEYFDKRFNSNLFPDDVLFVL